jgi:hypothetical protein
MEVEMMGLTNSHIRVVADRLGEVPGTAIEILLIGQSRAEIFDKGSYPKQNEDQNDDAKKPHTHHHGSRHRRHVHHSSPSLHRHIRHLIAM